MTEHYHSFAERFVRLNILNRFWSSAHTFVGLVSSFITLTALSVHQFGLYQLVLAAIALADTFSVNFFDEVVGNDISRNLSDNKRGAAKRLFHELAFLKIGLGLALVLALFFGADIVARIYDKDIGYYIRIASFLVGIRAVRSAAQVFLGAVVSLKALGASAVDEISKLFLISGFFFFSELSISRVLVATLVGALCALLYVVINMLREYSLFFRDVSALKVFLLKDILKKYGSWVLVRNAIKKAAKPIQPWLIVTFLGAEAVALYTLAVNLVTMVKDLFPAAGSSLLAWEVNNTERLRTIFSRGIKYSVLYGLLLMIFSFFFIPAIVAVLFPKYLQAMPLFSLYLLVVPLHGVQTLEMAVLTALREQKVLAARIAVEVMIRVGLFIMLVPFIGILADGAGVIAVVVWRTWFLYGQISRKYPEFKPELKMLFSFDQEDRLIAKRAFGEARAFLLGFLPSRRA